MKKLDATVAFTLWQDDRSTELLPESRTVPAADRVVRKFIRMLTRVEIRRAISSLYPSDSYSRAYPTSAGTGVYPFTLYVLSVELGRRLRVSDIIHAERMGRLRELSLNIVVQAVETKNDVQTIQSLAQC